MDHAKMDKPAMEQSKMVKKDMPSMPDMEKDMGIKHNPPVWYDFLLREDASRSPMLATDSMINRRTGLYHTKMSRFLGVLNGLSGGIRTQWSTGR